MLSRLMVIWSPSQLRKAQFGFKTGAINAVVHSHRRYQ